MEGRWPGTSVCNAWLPSTLGCGGEAGPTGTAWNLESHKGRWRNASRFVGPETAIVLKTQSAAQLSLKTPLYILDNKAQNYSLH